MFETQNDLLAPSSFSSSYSALTHPSSSDSPASHSKDSWTFQGGGGGSFDGGGASSSW